MRIIHVFLPLSSSWQVPSFFVQRRISCLFFLDASITLRLRTDVAVVVREKENASSHEEGEGLHSFLLDSFSCALTFSHWDKQTILTASDSQKGNWMSLFDEHSLPLHSYLLFFFFPCFLLLILTKRSKHNERKGKMKTSLSLQNKQRGDEVWIEGSLLS